MLRAASGSGNSPRLLAASAVASSITGTLTETALATVTIPAGAMGLNGGVEIRAVFTNNNSANNKVHRIRFGGLAGTVYSSATNTTQTIFSDARRIRNRNSASSQVGQWSAGAPPLGTLSGSLVTSSVDSGAAVDVAITTQLANVADTATLEFYEVWLLP